VTREFVNIVRLAVDLVLVDGIVFSAIDHGFAGFDTVPAFKYINIGIFCAHTMDDFWDCEFYTPFPRNLLTNLSPAEQKLAVKKLNRFADRRSA
jgi:hypothetical protein